MWSANSISAFFFCAFRLITLIEAKAIGSYTDFQSGESDLIPIRRTAVAQTNGADLPVFSANSINTQSVKALIEEPRDPFSTIDESSGQAATEPPVQRIIAQQQPSSFGSFTPSDLPPPIVPEVIIRGTGMQNSRLPPFFGSCRPF